MTVDWNVCFLTGFDNSMYWNIPFVWSECVCVWVCCLSVMNKKDRSVRTNANGTELCAYTQRRRRRRRRHQYNKPLENGMIFRRICTELSDQYINVAAHTYSDRSMFLPTPKHYIPYSHIWSLCTFHTLTITNSRYTVPTKFSLWRKVLLGNRSHMQGRWAYLYVLCVLFLLFSFSFQIILRQSELKKCIVVRIWNELIKIFVWHFIHSFMHIHS